MEEEARGGPTTETVCAPPSARCHATLTPHPCKDELILFGGEFTNGVKTQVYNDLFFYTPKKVRVQRWFVLVHSKNLDVYL